MIWLYIILQIIFIRINWWAYNTYYMNPKHTHPPAFWNPFFRRILLTMAWLGIIGLTISAFFLTTHPWQFLLFTIGFWLLIGYRGYKSIKDQSVEAGVKYEEPKTSNRTEKFIPKKEWLIDKILHEDIVNGAVYEYTLNYNLRALDGSPTKTRKDPRYAMVPSSKTESEEWIKFQKNIRADDEIWTFSSAIIKTPSPFHWAGVCLIRGGVIIDCVAEEIHFSYRQA